MGCTESRQSKIPPWFLEANEKLLLVAVADHKFQTFSWQTSSWVEGLLPRYPRQDVWSSSYSKLSPTEIAACGGYINGVGEVASCFKLNVVTEQWTELPPLQQARTGCGSAVCGDGSLLVIGGELAGKSLGNKTSIVERLLPGSNAFVPAADLQTPRSSPNVYTLADGRVLVCSGHGPRHELLTQAEIYCPQENSWRRVPDMRQGRTNYELISCEAFDVAAEKWVEDLPDMPLKRGFHCSWPLSETQALIAGGMHGTMIPPALIFDCKMSPKEMFHPLPALNFRKQFCSFSAVFHMKRQPAPVLPSNTLNSV